MKSELSHDIQIHTDSEEILRTEFAYIVAYFQSLGYSECEVRFGFARRSDPNSAEISWKTARIRLEKLQEEIRNVEAMGLGQFAHDDLFLRFDNVECEIPICHHSGVHLFFAKAGPITEHFFQRWFEAGLHPEEWEQEPDGNTWRRVLEASD